MTNYYAQFSPELKNTHYAEEIWALFEDGELYPEYVLTGEFEFETEEADVDSVLQEITAAFDEEQALQQRKRDAEDEL